MAFLDVTRPWPWIVWIVAVVLMSQDRSAWNVSHIPFQIYGNTYYVGVRGLSSVLITSAGGHVLIDGGLPESAAHIASSVRQLGFRLEDVQLIVNSHPHFDHAGGIAALQKLSGARVAALVSAAAVLTRGASGPDDPQFGVVPAFPAVADVQVIRHGETLHVGTLAITAHATAGHTRGGTTWTWRACEDTRCLNVVYADSLTAVSAQGFRYSDNKTYPEAVQDFERSFQRIADLPCDILLTPHPSAVGLFERAKQGTLVDPQACRAYAERGRRALRERLAGERGG